MKIMKKRFRDGQERVRMSKYIQLQFQKEKQERMGPDDYLKR